MPLSNEKLAVLERFGDGDIQDLVAEVRLLRAAIEKVLADEESGEGGWGPDVTMVAVLRDALGGEDAR